MALHQGNLAMITNRRPTCLLSFTDDGRPIFHAAINQPALIIG
jgi:hypothetical protein